MGSHEDLECGDCWDVAHTSFRAQSLEESSRSSSWNFPADTESSQSFGSTVFPGEQTLPPGDTPSTPRPSCNPRNNHKKTPWSLRTKRSPTSSGGLSLWQHYPQRIRKERRERKVFKGKAGKPIRGCREQEWLSPYPASGLGSLSSIQLLWAKVCWKWSLHLIKKTLTEALNPPIQSQAGCFPLRGPGLHLGMLGRSGQWAIEWCQSVPNKVPA